MSNKPPISYLLHTNMNQFCFVLIPGFSLVALSCAIDALRAANNIADKPLYEWRMVSVDGNEVISSSSIALQTKHIDEAETPDVIAICGGDRSHQYSNSQLTAWLHHMAAESKTIGSISDGAFVVAQTGLFNSVPSTIHWKCQDAYRERYPDLDIKPSMIEISGKRFSCAGGTASLDLMLHFIREQHGSSIAGMIADNYFHDTIRDESSVQHITNAYRIAGRNPQLADALLLMESHLENPLTIADISESIDISQRQLDRIFKKFVGTSPQSHYRDLRLTRASGLLAQTGLSISEIALGCGFHSASHLGKFFKKRFGMNPREYRNRSFSIHTE